jgi:hypothetical protein
VPDARTAIGLLGGIVTFLWSWLGGAREKRKVKEAAAVQEQFDTYVYDLPWNDMAAERVDPIRIATAAGRYRGNRTRDWYPPTDPVIRPLDILICQRSNLGWGAAVHQLYAAVLTGALLVLAGVGIGVAWLAHLTFVEALAAVALPLLAPGREIFDQIRANRESENTKRGTEAKISALWHQALAQVDRVQIADCRAVQDRIHGIRLSNAHVPDRIDALWRTRNESAMRVSAEHLVAEATQAGLVLPDA